MTPIETLNIHNHNVEIYYDDWANNPLEWYDSVLCTAHRSYTFGGEELSHDANSIQEAFLWHLDAKGLKENDVIYLPVYLYDHSGICLSTVPFSDRWDSGQLGYIYKIRKDMRRIFCVQRISPKLEQQIYDMLIQEVEELSDFVSGNVYGFRVPALDISLYGFYSDDHKKSGLIEAAIDEINHAVQEKRKVHFKQLKNLIRAKVPLQYRPVLTT
ncbi:MAG: hypothetical protein Q4A74_05010 [Cardiobacteriaceae bacterium]|nr:hypothetical protein [Cardiobacteriaceae bacterium]